MYTLRKGEYSLLWQFETLTGYFQTDNHSSRLYCFMCPSSAYGMWGWMPTHCHWLCSWSSNSVWGKQLTPCVLSPSLAPLSCCSTAGAWCWTETPFQPNPWPRYSRTRAGETSRLCPSEVWWSMGCDVWEYKLYVCGSEPLVCRPTCMCWAVWISVHKEGA